MCLGACGRRRCSPSQNPHRPRRSKMSKRNLLLSLLPLLILIASPANAREWQVDAAKSSLTFKGVYQGGPFEGKFGKFTAVIEMDEADISKDKFDVQVE